MEGNDLTVWGMGTGRNMRVHWTLLEFGLSYEFHPIGPRTGETRTEKFLELNRKHKIPVLRHGDLVVTESAAIISYISEAFEAPPDFYVPKNATERVRLNEWCFFIMTELDAHPLYIIRRHHDLKEIYGEAPEAVSSAKEYFTEQIQALVQKFDQGQPYLLGKRVTVADILLETCLDAAQLYDLPLPERLTTYQQQLRGRPAFHRAFQRNYPDRPVGVIK